MSARASVAAGLTVGLLALNPGAAWAGGLAADGGNLVFTGNPGEANSFNVLESSGELLFYDGVTSGVIDISPIPAQCAPSDNVAAKSVECPAAGVDLITANLGDGKDKFLVGGASSTKSVIPMRAVGDDGNDSLAGGNGPDVLNGGNGKDKLTGLEGDDAFKGGNGKDTISAATILIGDEPEGSDKINCGKAKDTVTADSSDKVSKNCENVFIIDD